MADVILLLAFAGLYYLLVKSRQSVLYEASEMCGEMTGVVITSKFELKFFFRTPWRRGV